MWIKSTTSSSLSVYILKHLLSSQDCSVHNQIHFATASKSFLSSQFLFLPWHRVQQAFNNEHGFVSLCGLPCSSLFLLHFLPSVVPCWAVTKRANCPQPSTPEQLWPPMLHHPTTSHNATALHLISDWIALECNMLLCTKPHCTVNGFASYATNGCGQHTVHNWHLFDCNKLQHKF